MSSGLYTHRTRNAGEIVTDVLYNTAHKNQQQNDVPDQAGALSDTLVDFQATQDPAPAGVANLVASVESEFQQLRFAFHDIKNALNGGVALAEWYIPVDVSPFAVVGKGARVYRATTQAIPLDSATATACIFNTIRYDTGITSSIVDPFFVLGTPTRLNAPVAGLYQINGWVEFDVTGSGGMVSASIRLNGAPTILAASEYACDGVQIPILAVSAQYILAAGDYVELMVLQTVASPLDVVNPEFGIELLNPTVVIPPVAQFTLSITESGTGTGTVVSAPGVINCPGVCAGVFNSGENVTLTPTATLGGFVQWTGDVPGGDEFNNPLIVNMDQNRTINAVFTAFALNIVEAGTGSGTVVSDIGGINCPGTCAASYAPGDIVQLTATATAGVFTGWTGDLVSISNPDSVTMSADKTVTANFELTGVWFAFASGGGTNLLGTVYIAPSTVLAVSGTIGAVQFLLPIDIVLTGLSVTMTTALAAAHTVDFQFNVGGVDDGTIVINLGVGVIGGAATGAISVSAGTLITIKATQSGGGGDDIQSLAVLYQPQ